MRSSYSLTIILIVSIFLFVFVWPQAIEKTAGFFNWKLSLDSARDSELVEEEIGNWKFLNVPFRLGLDLLGGAHLLFESDLSQVPESDRDNAMQGVRDVIERRVNFFGVSEPVVQISGKNRLIVELAGIKDVNQAIQMIGETPFLEFKEESADSQQLLDEFQKKIDAGQATELDSLALNEKIFISTGLNGSHLKRAQIVFDPQTGQPQVSLELNDEGAQLFAAITKKNIGKRVAIYLDGLPISVPVVQTEISNGQAIISGQFTPQEAKLLAIRLHSGALPVPVKLISQQTVGASLGAESLFKSLKAGVYGLLLVALFMILFYRLPGAVSVVALLVYVLIVLSVYKIIPVALTLAGVAGFILSLGMAVDANILIFARMKEELALGKTLSQALREGFSRAWLSIRDSHVTTLLGAAILYIFTTSIVKGFALTLGVGVLTSLFTAITVTRIFLALFTGQWFEGKKWLFR